MKIFFSENSVDYTTYTFNYAVYCAKESQAELPEIYDRGFLPYSNNLSLRWDTFYLARSLRVNLEKFEDTSENRRVNRQMEELNPKLEVYEKSSFDLKNEDFLSFCKKYIEERIGDDQMSEERLQYILNSDIASHIFKVSNTDKTLGYVIGLLENNMFHYWFAFFDTEYMKSHSIGKWMMWRLIRHAKDTGLSHAYLGTAYKPAALYKIRDHKGLEFYDGVGWSSDIADLKQRCETDLEPRHTDRFKFLEDPNSYIDQLNAI